MNAILPFKVIVTHDFLFFFFVAATLHHWKFFFYIFSFLFCDIVQGETNNSKNNLFECGGVSVTLPYLYCKKKTLRGAEWYINQARSPGFFVVFPLVFYIFVFVS